ncbi:MAG: hypothetical protein AAGB93_08105 [Planctomycetota bacterium]
MKDDRSDRVESEIEERKRSARRAALGPIGIVAAGALALGGKAVRPLLGHADDLARPAAGALDEAAGVAARHAEETHRGLERAAEGAFDVAAEGALLGVEYAADRDEDGKD